MSKKLYRPFWSYDVEKTEKWLQMMAEQGYKLVGLNRATRCFSFEKAEPKQREYRIVYNQKQGHELSKTLVNDGWIEAARSGNWLIVCNEKVNEQKYVPVRDGIIKRNQKVWAMHQYFLIFMLAFIGGHVTTLAFSSSDNSSEIVASPFWSITILVTLSFVLLSMVSVYSLIKINRTNKVLSNHIEETGYEESLMQYEGKLIKKRKIGWMYAPDLLEKWLEEMETKGFHLVKVSAFGTTFYFAKGEARNVAYCVDYQNTADVMYFNIHLQSGWNNVYTSKGPMQKWTIWSQLMDGDEERPLIYDDGDHLLKHAKRIMKTQVSICIFLIAIYLFNFSLNLNSLVRGYQGKIQIVGLLLMLIGIGLFSFLAVRTFRFYQRTKEKVYR